MKKTLVAAALMAAVGLLPAAAMAEGGKEGRAVFSPSGNLMDFIACPPMPRVLKEAGSFGYDCKRTGNTSYSVQMMLRYPGSFALGTKDAYDRLLADKPELTDMVTVARSDIARAMVLLVVKDSPVKNYGDFVASARRASLLVGTDLDSVVTLDNLRQRDPDGFGKIPKGGIEQVDGGDYTVISRVAKSTNGDMGLLVEVVTPDNFVFSYAQEKGVQIIPLTDLKFWSGDSPYRVTSALLPQGQKVSSISVPVVLLTASPKVFTDPEMADEQQAAIDRVAALPETVVHPLNPEQLSWALISKGVKGFWASVVKAMEPVWDLWDRGMKAMHP